MNLLPRFRGKAFEVNGGWTWEVWVTLIGNNEDGFMMYAQNLFSTKELAIDDMKIAIKLGCDTIQEKIMGHSNGEYIDMKSNETLKWDKSKHN
jgi:hypothetical protein